MKEYVAQSVIKYAKQRDEELKELRVFKTHNVCQACDKWLFPWGEQRVDVNLAKCARCGLRMHEGCGVELTYMLLHCAKCVVDILADPCAHCEMEMVKQTIGKQCQLCALWYCATCSIGEQGRKWQWCHEGTHVCPNCIEDAK